MFIGYYEIDKFTIEIKAIEDAIVSVKVVEQCSEINENQIIKVFKNQLDEFFNGKRMEFDIAYNLNQLPFRTKLYKEFQKVLYGDKAFVKDFLEVMGLDKGLNVIIRAMYYNPLILIVPCHRINNPLRRLRAYNYSDEFRKFLLDLESEGYNESKV